MRNQFFSIVAAAALLAAPAFAEPAAGAVSINVSYADLDLSKPEGARELAHRIDDAAARACGGSAGFDVDYRLSPSAAIAAFEACKHDAAASALSALNAPGVSRAYAENFASRRTL